MRYSEEIPGNESVAAEDAIGKAVIEEKETVAEEVHVERGIVETESVNEVLTEEAASGEANPKQRIPENYLGNRIKKGAR